MLPINLISLLLVIVIVITIIVILIWLNKKVNKEISNEKNKFLVHKNKVKKLLKKSITEEELEDFNKIVRDFFYKKFNLKTNLTYLELAKKLELQKGINKKKEYEKFCKLMPDILYSGKINPKKIKEAMKIFLNILDSSQ